MMASSPSWENSKEEMISEPPISQINGMKVEKCRLYSFLKNSMVDVNVEVKGINKKMRTLEERFGLLSMLNTIKVTHAETTTLQLLQSK